LGTIKNYLGRFFRPSPQRLANHLRGLPGLTFAETELQLHPLYQGCQHSKCTLDANTTNWAADLAHILAIEVARVWKSKKMPNSFNKSLTEAYSNIFLEGITTGYGVNLAEIDYSTPDWDMLFNLSKNAYQFSAAKNYTQLRQLTQALLDDAGKLRTYSQFKKAAYQINDTHTNPWLKAEYDTAVASAQMASKWVAIQKNKKQLPLLQFDAIIDQQTSVICRPLEGVIKPIEDPFWSMYYPPNHFRCRSTVRQLATGKITANHEIEHPEKVPNMFKTNMAKTGMLFPKDHPYWIDQFDDNTFFFQRKKAKEITILKFLNQVVLLDDFGKITFTKNSIKEMINQPHILYEKKMWLCTQADKLLKNSYPIKESNNNKMPHLKVWYRKVKGLDEDFYLVIKEQPDKSKVLYSIVEKLQ
jgi:SPP1 gp7 family putative phage head morphogenesis protein